MGLALAEVLERSRSAGFLGPGPVDEHIDHAHRFWAALQEAQSREGAELVDRTPAGGRLMDLGSGGGVPGLPLAVSVAELSLVLVDASQKRCSFLVWAAAELGVADRVEVWCGRAEDLAHQERARAQFDYVTARGFGPPASTVECGAPMLVHGGALAISEPPGGRVWPKVELATVGLVKIDMGNPHRSMAIFRKNGSVGDHYPRSSKDQQRSPLFVL